MQTVQQAPDQWIEQCVQRLDERWYTVVPLEDSGIYVRYAHIELLDGLI